jgi:hypothetical protein
MLAEPPGADREAVQAAQERAVVEPPPTEHAVEALGQRALGDVYAGRVVRERGVHFAGLEREGAEMGVRVKAARVALEELCEQAGRARPLAAVA